jgi:O-acetyl-ADP-ribose deacetylase (regulator of RNase III)
MPAMNGQVELTIGDILVEEADVIVNAANVDMIMGGGVARDILNEAGAEIEDEAMAQAPVVVGEVVVTSAGNLAARHLVHVAVVGGAEPDLYECTRNVLEAAAELGAASLAMPALGTGSAGVHPSVAAADICAALRDYFVETGSDMRVRVVIYEAAMYGAFDKALRQVFEGAE